MPDSLSQGDPAAKLLVLVDRPDVQDTMRGKPLSGQAGDIFDACCVAAGAERGALYITTLFPWRLREVKTKGVVTSLLAPDGRVLWHAGRGVTPEGHKAAEEGLERVRQSGANCVLAMGQIAADLAANKPTALLKWRGSILHGTQAIAERKVIPTIHPRDTTFGTTLWRYNIIADLRRAVAESADFRLNLPERQLLIEPSFDEVMRFMQACRAAGQFATDLEVINHQVTCFSLCHDPLVAMTVPFVTEDQQNRWTLDEEIAIWREYGRLMSATDIAKVNQNLIGFDAPFLLLQNGIHTRGPLYDTMIAQHILYPEFPKGLDYIGSIYTREPYYKDEGKLWKNEGGDWPTFWRYCAKDSAVALEAWRELETELRGGGYWSTYESTAALADPLMYMTARGLAIEQSALEATKQRVTATLDELTRELLAVAETPFNPASSKQCIEYFYGVKRLTPYRSKTGAPTADDKAMSRIFRKTGLREAKLVQEIRSLKKLLTTYIEVALDSDDRLRCSWNPRGTWTGRLSSSQTIFGTGLNLQNLHPQFKDFVVATTE